MNAFYVVNGSFSSIPNRVVKVSIHCDVDVQEDNLLTPGVALKYQKVKKPVPGVLLLHAEKKQCIELFVCFIFNFETPGRLFLIRAYPETDKNS
jgi:hypothetical protein